MSKLNYEADLSIEIDALDIEFMRHPMKYMKYADMASDAEKNVKERKRDLEIIDAQIAKEVRVAEAKVTDSLLKERITLDIRHQEALNLYNEALYISSQCDNAVKGMEHKKSALENEAKLWLSGYFSTPKADKEKRQAFAEKKEERLEEIGRKQRERLINEG